MLMITMRQTVNDLTNRWFLDPRNLKSSAGKEIIVNHELSRLSERFPTDHVVWPSYCPLGGFRPKHMKRTLRWRIYRAMSAFREIRTIGGSLMISFLGGISAWRWRPFRLRIE